MKRFLIVLISTVFFAACWVRDLILRAAGRKPPACCVVLYYHAVPDAQKAHFESQMDDLIRFADPLPADQRLPLVPGKNYAIVTFDDAYRNILANALPALKDRGIPSTIFVVTEMLGRTAELYDSSASSVDDRLVMSTQDLQSVSSVLVTVGSHSVTHPFLSRLTPEEARVELSQSRRVLEMMLQKPIRLFCFPYGDCNRELFQFCREAGYERVFTTLPQRALSDAAEFVTGRVRVDPTDWRIEFRLKLRGAYRWLPYAFALKRTILRRRPADTTSQPVAVGQ
jgi:peptidoglycan/xylan/chitin deacetylase (PgdA/CDA1 family)